MNKDQKELLAKYTSHILENYADAEIVLKLAGIPKKYIKKINKALDLIFEVNQDCFK
jgi:hypothetical protein